MYEPPSEIRLARWMVDALYLHAGDVSPYECCGLLAGQKDNEIWTVSDIFPVQNEASSETEYHAGAGLFGPFKQMRSEGTEHLAIYHSHPNAPAKPSQTDLERNHYPHVAHGILSLSDQQLNFFWLEESKGKSIKLTVTDEPAGDIDWLRLAVAHSYRCPRSETSFAVGCVIVSAKGHLISTGYSLERGPSYHAEHSALEKAQQKNASLEGAILYTSLEPCSVRASGKRPCVDRILETGIRRVVYGMSEPPVFVRCTGDRDLKSAGIEVVALEEVAPLVARINRHVLEPKAPDR